MPKKSPSERKLPQTKRICLTVIESLLIRNKAIIKQIPITDNDSSSPEEEEEYELEFKSAKIRLNDEQFSLSNMGCCICNQNFPDQQKIDDHVALHKTINNRVSTWERPSSLRVFYSACILSNNLDFTIRTDLNGVVLQKIILVLSTFTYIHLHELPSEMPDGESRF